MISRYTITLSAQELCKAFELQLSENYKPRYNAAPTQLLPIIINTNPEGISFFYWGTTPLIAKNKSVANRLLTSDIEKAQTSRSLKSGLENNRCIIPADGFYLWKHVGEKTQIPHRIALLNKGLFAFAGIWEEFESEDGLVLHTFRILTTAATSLVLEFNPRMPWVLTVDESKTWLSETNIAFDIVPEINPGLEFHAYSVSPRINSIEEEGESLIRKVSPTDQYGNYSLFD